MDTPKTVTNDIREKFHLTDEQIARLVESHQPIIWRIRSGKTEGCNSSLYIKLCMLREKLLKKGSKK